MNATEFETMLLIWGHAFGPRSAEAVVASYGSSTLAGLGRPTIRQVTTMDRGGHQRRRLMGAAAGLVDEHGRPRLLPSWAAEPVRGSSTRSAGAKVLATDSIIPTEAARVEQSVKRLAREESELALVLRAQYCQLGRQAEKAEAMGMARNAYRERLAEARGWLRRDLCG